MFALIDCNNFFVSCERAFNPKLENKPVAVLSNNDGCIISRSNEAKKMGIHMGDPFFLHEEKIKKGQLTVTSSNFSLYADISYRIYKCIETFGVDYEIYSIDEAFIPLYMPGQELYWMKQLQKDILQCTSIPTSIGIAPTKTLAKFATSIAKNNQGIFNISDAEKAKALLSNISLDKIWGIGSKTAKKLAKKQLYTAADLINSEHEQIKKWTNITVAQTRLELLGIPCLTSEKLSSPQSILSSRSFKRPLKDKEDLIQALSSYCAIAIKKLRKRQLKTSFISIFIETSRFSNSYYSNSACSYLTTPVDTLPSLLQIIRSLLTKIFKPGLEYKRCGVIFLDLSSSCVSQKDLFTASTDEIKEENAMLALEKIQKKYHDKAIYFASEGIHKLWAFNNAFRSPRYTTCWEELPHVDLD